MQGLVLRVPAVRFRLSSIEATEVDDALVDLVASEPHRVAPHLHAPLQSGSDAVLKRMGRHWYTAAAYARAVERLASRVPVLGLGADVIVGFPGESDADFDATLGVVRNLPFTYLHVFTYSARPGTAAPRLGAAVPGDVAERRSGRLRDIAAARQRDHQHRRAGGVADAIVVRGGGSPAAITEDFLTVPVAERCARGERFPAQLRMDGGRLVARPRR
jgi:threonylcarbamoyladenosine tRNA methylthiotransferase MtaB